MKIALLARNPRLYSHRRIVEAARARGHDIEVLNTLRVSININSRKPMLYYRKRRLEDFDAVNADRCAGDIAERPTCPTARAPHRRDRAEVHNGCRHFARRGHGYTTLSTRRSSTSASSRTPRNDTSTTRTHRFGFTRTTRPS